MIEIKLNPSPIQQKEIQQFFESFATDFSQFSGKLIAERYATPCIALNADGRLSGFSTREQVSEYFQGHLDRYRSQGCRACRFLDLETVPLGTQSSLVTVTWQLLAADGSIASSWRESYNLRRTALGLQVFASTDHVG